MKLSFSLPSKASSRPNVKALQKFNNGETEDADQKESVLEFVTEFDPSKLVAHNQPKRHIIPPKPNEWRPHKKMKNIEIPLQASDDPNLRFELEDPSLASMDGGSAVSYGLNLRETSKDNRTHENIEGGKPYKPIPVERVMLQKLKNDLRDLPDDRGFDEFVDMEVEGFGAALLAGYGWHEGKGIGRNAKEDVKAVQYEKRAGREGFGFTDYTSHGKKKEKESGIPEWVSIGNDVRIVSGRDEGLKGKIVKIVDADSGGPLLLKLSRSDERVTLHIHEVAELGSEKEEKCLMRLKEFEIRNDQRDSSGSQRHKERRDPRKEDKTKDVKLGRVKEEYGISAVSWLARHIRVRVISKKFKGGRMYLKKAKVIDVVGPTTCDLSMDESNELIQGVDQNLLETALPRRGGSVLVLYGKHKGVYGNLVERDAEKERGIVRDADSHELVNVRLNEIAEYVGDPSDIGY